MNATPLPRSALERLPSGRGRHRLTREDVAASQRGRLLFAIAEAVAEKGYAATTVSDIVERAGVSRRTFYELFPDKEACFLAAFDMGVEVLLGLFQEAEAELGEDADWRAHLRANLSTFLEALARDPAVAWLIHIEALGAGAAALERRAEIFALFTERTRRLYELARRQDPGLPELPDEAFKLHSGGIDELVRDCLRTRGADALSDLLEPCMQASLALFEK